MIASRALVVLFALLGPACFSPQGATSETSDPTNATSTSTSSASPTSTSETAPTTSSTTVAPDPTTTSEGTSTTTSTSTTAVSATTEATTADATTTTTTGDETTEPDTTSTSTSTTTTAGPIGECGDGIVDVGEECDDGNDDDADTCTNACTHPTCGDGILHADEECDELGDNCMSCKRQWMQVFVTSTKSNGNLDGLTGADEMCQERADSAGVKGRFKAWIGTQGAPATARLQHSLRPYKRLDGAQVATSWGDLTDGMLLNEIDIDEDGDPAVQAMDCGACPVWTGTLTNGSAYTDNCNGWIFGGFQNTRVGECTLKDMRWTDGCGSLQCSQSARLYCLEQGLTP